MNVANPTHCFFSPSGPTILDAVNPLTGRGLYSNQTLDQHARLYPDAILLSNDEATARIEQAFLTAPVEITRERFEDMRDMLPPQGWTHVGGAETFQFLERKTLRVTLTFAKWGGRYFEWYDIAGTQHEKLVEKVIASDAVFGSEIEAAAERRRIDHYLETGVDLSNQQESEQ